MIRRVLLAALAAALVLTRGAHAEPDDPGSPSFEQLGELAARLDLSADQRRAVRTLVDDAHKTTIQARAQLEILQIDLRRALEEGDPAPDPIGAMIDRISGLEATMRKARIVTLVRVRKLLTPAQRKLLDEARGVAAATPPMPPMPPMPPAPSGLSRPAGSGQIFVNATPFAEISIDGRAAGMTPLKLAVAAGSHVVEARWRGYGTRRATVMVPAGGTAKLVLKAN